MKNVYIVEHCYEYEVAEDVIKENVKVIGIYNSYKKAKKAVKKFKDKRGFNRFSKKCFNISRCKLNQSYWKDGFITYDGSTGEWIE